MKLVLTIEVPDKGPNAADVNDLLTRVAHNRMTGEGLSITLPNGTAKGYSFDGVLAHVGLESQERRII